MKKRLFSIALICGSSLLAAEETTQENLPPAKSAEKICISLEDWSGFKTEKKNDVLVVSTETSASFTLTSERRFDINPTKKYRLSAEIRLDSGKLGASTVLIGFLPLKKNGAYIAPIFVQVAPGTNICSLAEDAKAGSTALILADSNWSEKWNPETSYFPLFAAFNAKRDFSDLPNEDVARIMSLEPKEGKTTAVLQKPLKSSYPAGTLLHATRGNGYQYCAKKRFTVRNEWSVVEGVVQGYAKNGEYPDDAWRPGSASAAVLILGTNAKDTVWSIRNVKLEEVTK